MNGYITLPAEYIGHIDATQNPQHEVYRLQHIVDAQYDALIHWRRAYDELVAENRRKTELNTKIQQRYADLRSAFHVFGESIHGWVIEPTAVRDAIHELAKKIISIDFKVGEDAKQYQDQHGIGGMNGINNSKA